MNIKAIREELTGKVPVPFQRAVELRAKLEGWAEEHYHAKTPPSKVIAFINKNGNGLQLTKVHPTDPKVGFVGNCYTQNPMGVRRLPG